MKHQGWRISLLVIFILLAIVLLYFHSKTEKKGFAVFSWNTELMEEEQRETLLSCIRQANVTELYQQFSAEDLKKESTQRFLHDMMQENITVYALYGDALWTYEDQHSDMKEAIHEVIAYNAYADKNDQIKGIVMDVEPYLLEEWEEGKDKRHDIMEQYLKGMKEAYAYAKEHGLRYIVCIPTFFDVTNEDILEDLIASGCDGIAIMNYNRNDEAGQIEREMELSCSYQKQVINIYELQDTSYHDLEDINTYANIGLPALWESVKDLEARFDYDDFTFAYHHYEALIQLLKQEGAIEYE